MANGRAPRRVLFVTSNFPRWAGDATTPFVLHLASDLRGLGWAVDVLAPHAPGALRDEVLEGIPVHRFRYLLPESAQTVCYGGVALSRLGRNPLEHAKLPALVASEFHAAWRRLPDYDLVHSHWLLPQGYAAGWASRLRRVPHVVTVHGGDVFGLRSAAVMRFKRAAVRMADAVTANSSVTAALVLELGCAGTQLERIPMGATVPTPPAPQAVADLRDALLQGRPGPLIVFVGRLVEEKGAADLLDAAALLRPELPGLAVAIVGDGPERAALDAGARRLGLADVTTFAGWQPPAGVALHLAAADCFVGPSRTASHGWREAQGLTFAEAMLAGAPVVATRSGGIADLVHDGATGMLVDERAPAQIAAAVLRLVREPGLVDRLRGAALALVRREHTRAASAAAFAALYERLVSRGPRARR